MNVPKEYDGEAERLLTHPLLLPKQDIPNIITKPDKAALKKTNDTISLARRVFFKLCICTAPSSRWVSPPHLTSWASGGIYGNGLSVTHGEIYLYLGINFDYSDMGDVKLTMIPYHK